MLFPVTFSKKDSKTKLVGSYGRAIPSSLGYGDAAYSEFSLKDIDKTIEALIGTSHTMYGYNADDGVAWDNDGDKYWVEFLEILEKTSNTDIKIFATVRDRHLPTAGWENRWGVIAGPLGGVDRVTAASSDSDAAVGWAIAAEEFSKLSLLFPHFIGFTVDDFGPVNDPTYGGYSYDEIKNITLSAKIHNPNFKFWPTQYFNEMLKQIIPSVVIGVTTGQPMWIGEYVASEYIFNIKSAPDSARLSFLMSDGNKKEAHTGLRKKIYINDSLIYDMDSAAHQFVEEINEDIANHLDIGENIIRVEVLATGYVNRWVNKLLYIEEPMLVIDNINIISMIQSFDRQDSYIGDSGSDSHGEYNGRVITNPPQNSLYSDSVDGFFSVYTNKSEFDGMAELLIRKYKSRIGRKDLNYIEQSFLAGKDINSQSTVNKLSKASSAAHATLAWNWPMDLYHPEFGVFSQKTPSHLPTFPMLTVWPERHSGAPGWSQTWTTIDTYSGTVEIKVKDNHHEDVGDYFLKKIYTSDGADLYSDTTGEVEGADKNTAEILSINLGVDPVNVSFEISLIAGVGSLPLRMEFGMKADGSWLEQSDFSFNSGTNDPIINSAYQSLVDYFARPPWER